MELGQELESETGIVEWEFQYSQYSIAVGIGSGEGESQCSQCSTAVGTVVEMKLPAAHSMTG